MTFSVIFSLILRIINKGQRNALIYFYVREGIKYQIRQKADQHAAVLVKAVELNRSVT